MSLIKKFRISIGNSLYKRKVSKLRRSIRAIGLQQAKTAAILFDANNQANLKHVKDLIKHLPGNASISAIGFINGKRKNYSYIGDKIYNFIDEDDFSFFMQPKTESVKNLINQEYDIIFILSYNYYFSIDIISGLSRALFKVGQSGVYEKNLDLYIETDKKDPEYLISQLVHYLG